MPLSNLPCNNRLLVLLAAGFVAFYGMRSASELPIDVLPDITRPRVSLLTECPGLAPEEVGGVGDVATGIGIERSDGRGDDSQFLRHWLVGDPGRVRLEPGNLSGAADCTGATGGSRGGLAAGDGAQAAPISSLLGQIMLVGMWSEDGTTSPIELRTWRIGPSVNV